MMSMFLPGSHLFTDVHQAISLLANGKVVALPTETVYGLAGLGYHPDAIETIYCLKQRPKHNPLIIHYARIEDTENDVLWTDWAKYLAQRFWPGPLTIVLSLAPNTRIPLLATGGLNSAAIRVPAHPCMQEILQHLPGPLAAPSANLSGQLSPTTAGHVAQYLPVPTLDAGPCMYGVESTIVDGRHWPVQILRPGALSVETIADILLTMSHDVQHAGQTPVLHKNFDVSLDKTHPKHILCPGQMTSHYAPKKPLRLNATSVSENEGLLAFGPPLNGAKHCFQLSLDHNLEQAASCLFAGLHHLDQTDCTAIAVMPIPQRGMGTTILDRLYRASMPTEHT